MTETGRRFVIQLSRAFSILLPLIAALYFCCQVSGAQQKHCDLGYIQNALSHQPQKRLSALDRFVAFATTLFKRLGISGWTETQCQAEAIGVLVRNAQHSSDGFWTIDIQLKRLSVEGSLLNVEQRFIRIEVERGTEAHATCSRHHGKSEEQIQVGGPILIDRDGPFLEIHPLKAVFD